MKPLELTRSEWITEENLNMYFVTALIGLYNPRGHRCPSFHPLCKGFLSFFLYFVTAKDVLVNAGVAEMNRGFDPNVPCSHVLVITYPERIFSYYD